MMPNATFSLASPSTGRGDGAEGPPPATPRSALCWARAERRRIAAGCKQKGHDVIAEIRIYTVNKGMMDDFVKLWNEKLAPTHAKYGIKILGAWANRPQNEFIWIRSFENEADRDAKLKTYFDSPERSALGDLPPSHMAKMEVRTVEDVFAPGPPIA
jgi:hypothetical protein